MSELKKIYQATGPGDAHVLRGLLEAEGIAVVVRGDDFVPLQGGSLFTVETRPSLWVLDDDSYARARDLADHYASNARSEPPASGETWTCRACGEAVEVQFTACWSCGKSRAQGWRTS